MLEAAERRIDYFDRWLGYGLAAWRGQKLSAKKNRHRPRGL